MKLEDLNLVELNAQEIQEVDGGFFTFIALGALVIGVGLIANNNGKKVNGPGGNGSNTAYYKEGLLTGGTF
jgi:lactobin A/cerein 7B family class IIb bacteriocin